MLFFPDFAKEKLLHHFTFDLASATLWLKPELSPEKVACREA